jgi:hypothetical protein
MAFFPCILSQVTDNLDALNVFPDLATIYNQTNASVGGGNRSKTPGAAATDVPIRLYNLKNAVENERVGQIKAVRGFGASIPASQAVTEKQTLTITSLSNRSFQITKVIKVSDATTTRLELEEIG